MAQRFGHEKLKVYQKGMDVVEIRGAILNGLLRRVAAMLTSLSKVASDET